MGRKLGEGAFGTVYEATHIQANRACAVKIISKRKLKQHQIYVNLMDQELEALDQLEHPHIVHVLDLLQDDDNYYIIAVHCTTTLQPLFLRAGVVHAQSQGC